MTADIRDKAYIDHADMVGLNFINPESAYLFRRHFRQGLRSHVMEVLDSEAMEIEKSGTVINGIRWYPKATPLHIFRIFRTRIYNLAHALDEIRRVRIAETYLLPDHLARSTEIIVDYNGPVGRQPILCGLQEYVQGEIIDPWAPLPKDGLLPAMYDKLKHNMGESIEPIASWIGKTRQNSRGFIDRIKRMISESHHIPDLAGIGNLLMTASGVIKLVDINNISTIVFEDTIHLDDRGYPVCDKSVEALSILEHHLIGKPIDRKEKVYSIFLDPMRMRAVSAKEMEYHHRNQTEPD